MSKAADRATKRRVFTKPDTSNTYGGIHGALLGRIKDDLKTKPLAEVVRDLELLKAVASLSLKKRGEKVTAKNLYLELGRAIKR
jgi:hypothetical protein